MEKKSEKNFSYADISSGALDRMKRFASESDFESAFNRRIDLIDSDNDLFNEFLKLPELQEKLATAFEKIVPEITNCPKVTQNLRERIDNAIKIFYCLNPEIRQRQNMKDLLSKLYDYSIENDDEFDIHHWKLFTS